MKNNGFSLLCFLFTLYNQLPNFIVLLLFAFAK